MITHVLSRHIRRPAVIHADCRCRRGHPGEEAQDYGYKFAVTRRRSNSSTYGNAIGDFKTKFEQVEADPVFEEEFHGAFPEDNEDDLTLTKEDSAASTSTGSIDDDEISKKL